MNDLTVSWVRTGGLCGVLAWICFAVMAAAPIPDVAAAALVAAFGPLLSVASVGLYHLLRLERRAVSLQIAAVSNVVAGALITAMLMVQLAVRSGGRGQVPEDVWIKLRHVDLGLDVAWDAYIILGTFLFALNMLRHPRFGKVFGGLGLLIIAALAVLNIATFPTPPGNAGLVDLGPAAGLWYLVVSVQTLRSVDWAGARAARAAASA